jgi:hypothetical protein
VGIGEDQNGQDLPRDAEEKYRATTDVVREPTNREQSGE